MNSKEIKFMAWDGVDYMSNPFTLYDIQAGRIQFTHDVVFREYTGLKDKNGKEIYEFDLVKWETENPERPFIIEEVVYNGGSFDPVSQMPGSEFEVIGNKFQNPELLK